MNDWVGTEKQDAKYVRARLDDQRWLRIGLYAMQQQNVRIMTFQLR